MPQFIAPAEARLADSLRRRIAAPHVLPWITRMVGGALITLGITKATLRRPSV